MSATSVFLVQRRATLLLEEFLLGLGATYVSSLGGDEVGFDTMAFFTSQDGSTKVIAIELKATEKEVGGRYALPIQTIKRLAGMNIPALIVVADVKRNEVFFTWAQDAYSVAQDGSMRTIPLRKASPQENKGLVAEIFGVSHASSTLS